MQAELTGVLTNNHQDTWKSFQGRMLRRNGYRNLKVGNVRESLGAGILWSSLDFLCASKKEKQVSLGLYIARGKKEITPAQEFREECTTETAAIEMSRITFFIT